jgi:hypothetical protein
VDLKCELLIWGLAAIAATYLVFSFGYDIARWL